MNNIAVFEANNKRAVLDRLVVFHW